jgi:hypothetical protein
VLAESLAEIKSTNETPLLTNRYDVESAESLVTVND